jgi:hypothetical protein
MNTIDTQGTNNVGNLTRDNLKSTLGSKAKNRSKSVAEKETKEEVPEHYEVKIMNPAAGRPKKK